MVMGPNSRTKTDYIKSSVVILPNFRLYHQNRHTLEVGIHKKKKQSTDYLQCYTIFLKPLKTGNIRGVKYNFVGNFECIRVSHSWKIP